MARRKVTVRDMGEILDHGQSGRGIRAVARSLGVSRPTIRKCVAIARSHGYEVGGSPPAEGWRFFWNPTLTLSAVTYCNHWSQFWLS